MANEMSILQEEIIKLKRRHVAEIMQSVKILLILGDKSYLTLTEKHNLKLIENAASTLQQSLNEKFIEDKIEDK